MVNEDTVEIYTLWDRLKKRFSIVKPHPKSFILNDTVQPITSVDFPLSATKMLTGTTTVTGNGYKTTHIVPTGKRWEVYAIDIWKASGTYDVVGIYSTDGSSGACHIDMFAAVTRKVYACPSPLPMNEGFTIAGEVENHAANGSLYLFVWYKETDMEE